MENYTVQQFLDMTDFIGDWRNKVNRRLESFSHRLKNASDTNEDFIIIKSVRNDINTLIRFGMPTDALMYGDCGFSGIHGVLLRSAFANLIDERRKEREAIESGGEESFWTQYKRGDDLAGVIDCLSYSNIESIIKHITELVKIEEDFIARETKTP